MEKHHELSPGMRVRVIGTPIGLSLRSPLGTVVRPDDWDGYYVVRLDVPAVSVDPATPQQEVLEIAEYYDNLEVEDPFTPDAEYQQSTIQSEVQDR